VVRRYIRDGFDVKSIGAMDHTALHRVAQGYGEAELIVQRMLAEGKHLPWRSAKSNSKSEDDHDNDDPDSISDQRMEKEKEEEEEEQFIDALTQLAEHNMDARLCFRNDIHILNQ